MGMIDSIKWWLSFRRNVNFWDWTKDTYSADELHRLATEPTDCSLINPYDPTAELTLDQQERDEAIRQETARRLYRRYGDEIWEICLGAGGYDPDRGPTGVICLGKLDLSFQVYKPELFEEFMVRNALKYAARQIVQKTRSG
jgi:hypothetical protein